jgi:DNA polymerase-3 subunit gamma/tau
VRDSLGLTADARGRQLVRHVLDKDLSAGLKLIAAVRDDGVDMRQFQREVVNYLRALLVVKAGAEDTLDLAVEEGEPAVRPPFPAGRQGAPRQPSKLRARLQETEEQTPKQPPKQAKPAAPTGEVESQASEVATPSGGGEKEASKAAAPADEGESQSAEAAPAAATTAADDDLLQRIRLACKEVDHRVAAYLNGTCEIKSLEDGVLVLAFYQQFDFHREKTETPDNRRIVEEAASRLMGQTITLECTVCERPRAEGKPSMRGGHLVQAARQMGARPVVGGKGGSSGEPRNET